MPTKLVTRRLDALRRLDPKIEATYSRDGAAIRSVRGLLAPPIALDQLRARPHAIAREFIHANRALVRELDEAHELRDGRVTVDRRDRTHVVFRQRLGDAEVVGAGVSVHYDAQGHVYLMRSSLSERLQLDAHPGVDANKAAAAALRHAGERARLSDDPPALSVVSRETLHRLREPRPWILCWKVLVLKERGPDWIYWIDAQHEKVLMRYPSDQDGAGVGHYSVGAALASEPFTTTTGSTSYRLRDDDSTSTWPVAVKPVMHTYDDNGSTSTSLTDYSVDGNDNWNATGQRAEVDIHRFLRYAVEYYYTTFGYNGLDGNGKDAKAHAHNEKYANNAFWSGSTKQLYFADGDGTTRDLMCPLDTVMHEYSHGVKYYLDVVQVYDGESGALNEATSDIFGAFLAVGHPAEDPWPWHHGRQYRLDGTVGRNLSDPARDTAGVVQYDATNNATKWNSASNGFYPDHYSVRYTGSGDYHGVHINAPIIGHALFLMIQGGTHRLSGVSVAGIGVGPVEEICWEALSTGLLTNTSDFADFRLACILACQTLFPENLDYLASVKAAFLAIGVGPDLFVRDTIADDGDEPGTLSCMSPDIILRQNHADAATLTLIADLGNGSLGEEIEHSSAGSSDHYVYFRVQNRGAEAASGRFRLFISPVSTFPSPSAWTEVGHYDFGVVPANNGVWTPSAATQCITLPGSVIDALGTGHFCFIGVIESDVDPAPDFTLINSVSEFHSYIRMSNNFAWRNTNIVAVTPDTSGEVAATEQAFELHGFGRGRQGKILEVDTRALPRETELVLWIPARHYFGLKVSDNRMAIAPGRIVRPVAVNALRRPALNRIEPVRLANTAVNAPLLDRAILERFARLRRYPVRVSAGKVITLEGFALGGDERLTLNFTVKFPRQRGARNVVLGFRERYKNDVIGQMNYVFQLRPR